MPAPRQNMIRIVLLFLILFSTASCGLLKTQKPPVPQAQDAPEPEATSIPMDTPLDQDIRTRYLEEKINRLEKRIALLEKKSGSQIKPPPPSSSSSQQTPPASPAKSNQPVQPDHSAQTGDLDPVKLYKKGRALLLERNIPQAQTLFSDFVKQFPDHELADNAVYWLGECSYTTGNYETAAKIFKKLVQTYPKSRKVPDALLKTGYCYISIDNVNQANHYFKQVITRYPFSPAADKAQQKLSLNQ
ncbi:tol-pal system protein YbgF [Desulfobacter latus]|uniref:Tol-pal system protein YbgF n=1 Tax=Desulfobacter latus TaxID=2292 RepID=A0A850T7Z2_9BACT|nr:tol-pal system protein YbgF [Desulfobacter latus]NWH05572.1 tol-pal system protein YbgF [Desulfobacter latus]